MKAITVTVFAWLCSLAAFAADDWKSYFKTNDVEVLYRYADCHDTHNGIHQQKVLLKFVNYQNKRVAVYYSKELTFSPAVAGSPDMKEFTVTLEPAGTAEGTCETRDNALYIFSRQLNLQAATELKKFELKNISVKTIQ